MKFPVKPLFFVLAASVSITLAGCDDDDDPVSAPVDTGSEMDPGDTVEPTRLHSYIASMENGGGELLIDDDAKLTWINDTALDSRGDGCVSPANVGPTEPSEANGRCESQQFGGFTDWRAPTTAELTEMYAVAASESVEIKYLNPACPALVGSDGIVRTDNTNDTAASLFPNAQAGDVLGNMLSDLGGLGAGVRCVRDGIEEQPPYVRYTSVIASDENGGGEMLVDNATGLTWVNDASLDSRGDGCVSPANIGFFEPAATEALCAEQRFGGFVDWRAPTAAELTVLMTSAAIEGVEIKYLNPACPALEGSDGIVRTDRPNETAASLFPDAKAGDVLGTTLSDLGGLGAGLRCVRNGTEASPDQVRFSARVADAANARGETLVDHVAGLEWINDDALDARGEGCISPANVGPTEPSEADGRCVNQQFAGHTDWRAPTVTELSDLLRATNSLDIKLKYLNEGCPALVASDGIVRTENPNDTVASLFPNAQAGDVLGTMLSDLGGLGAGVRCVRDM